MNDPLGAVARRRRSLRKLAAQLHQAVARDIGEERFAAWMLAVGRGVRNTGSPRHRAQRKRRESFLFQDGARRCTQGGRELAMMVRAFRFARVHLWL